MQEFDEFVVSYVEERLLNPARLQEILINVLDRR